jgi:hypothetical protein
MIYSGNSFGVEVLRQQKLAAARQPPTKYFPQRLLPGILLGCR